MTINGTAGNDTLTGTSGNDTFNLTQGGDDTVSGLAGNDIFNFGNTFTAADTVDGGDGSDTVRLSGDYSAGITLGATTLTNVEQIQLAAGSSYNLTTDDANVAAGATLAINASALGAGDSLTFNGAAEGDGRFNILGGAGNDVVIGGSGNDTFQLGTGGNDHALGRAGNDTFIMGAALNAADKIDGGTGADTVTLSGNYSSANALTLGPTTLTNIETLKLGAGFNYDITTDEATVSSGATLTVDASALGAANSLIFDGSPESNGHFDIIAGAGNDIITGSSNNTNVFGDTFDLSAGGNDIASGHGTFLMGAALNAHDAIEGTDSSDTVVLDGDYSAGLVLGSTTITDISEMHFTAGHSYNITEANGNVAAGAAFLFDGSALGAGDNLTISAPNESNSLLTFTAGAGTNTFTSGNQDSTFNGGSGTNIFTGGNHADDFNMSVADTASTLTGGGGNDVFTFAAFNPATDTIDGGTGNDTVTFESGTFTLTATDLVNVERIELGEANVTTVDATVAAGQTMTVDARTTSASFDGSAETDGHFSFFTGVVDEPTTLIGGALSDSFNLATPSDTTVTGGGGADTFLLTGSQFGSHYTFVYDAVSDSTSTGYDTITHLNYNDAKFDVSGIGAVTGVDTAVHTGSLSTATFDSDLATDIGAGQLAAHHAVLFTADAGTLSGDTFLIVDENGTAGYQAGGDLVIDVTGHTGSGTLTTASFI